MLKITKEKFCVWVFRNMKGINVLKGLNLVSLNLIFLTQIFDTFSLSTWAQVESI